MAKLLIVALALIGWCFGEPSFGHNYHSSPSQWQDYSAYNRGGPYTPVPVGPQTSEGYHVDPHLLEKIKHIILHDEIHNGPKEYPDGERIVGIEVFQIQQSIEVAQYHQTEGDLGTDSYSNSGYREDSSNGPSKYDSSPSRSYLPPSNSYENPAPTPSYEGLHKSSSYDAPIQSSYEAPHSSPSSDYPSSSKDELPPTSPSADSSPATGNDDPFTSPSSDVPPQSSYEESHSLNTRQIRRTPFYNAPHRPIFYRYG